MYQESNKPSTQASFSLKINQVLTDLIELDFYIEAHDPFEHGYRIRLGCGIVITLYFSGKTLVQGKLKIESGKEALLKTLVGLLPQRSKWLLGNPEDTQRAMQLQQARQRAEHQAIPFSNSFPVMVRAAVNRACSKKEAYMQTL